MDVTQERLRQVLRYEPESGRFVRICGAGGRKAGSIAGATRSDGYIQVALDRRMYLAHRLAYFYVTGSWPCQIDHRDGNRANNAWGNLRQATPVLNQQNHRKAYKNSSTGLLGSSVDRARNKFAARIKIGHQNKTLGRFDTPEEAHDAYLKAKRKHHEGNTL